MQSISAKPSIRIQLWGESIGMAAEVNKGVCTDLPPMRKK
jgi:hypothetical protein